MNKIEKYREVATVIENYYSRMNRVLNTKRPIAHVLADDNITMTTTLKNLFTQFEEEHKDVLMPLLKWDCLHGLATSDGAIIKKGDNPFSFNVSAGIINPENKINSKIEYTFNNANTNYTKVMADTPIDLVIAYERAKEIWSSCIDTLFNYCDDFIIKFEPILLITNPTLGARPSSRELSIFNNILSYSTKMNKFISNNIITDNDKLIAFNPHIIVIDDKLLDNNDYGVPNYSKYAEIVDFKVVPFDVIKSYLTFKRMNFDFSKEIFDNDNKNKETSINLTKIKNINKKIEHLAFDLQYPYGFTSYELEDVQLLSEAMAGFSILEIQNMINAAHQVGEKLEYRKLIEYRTNKYRHNPLIRFLDPVDIKDVGGMYGIKEYIQVVKNSFSEKHLNEFPEARLPNGMLLVGVGGTGKTFIGQAVADVLDIPMIHLQIGSLKGSRLGVSEERTREAFDLIEAIGSCVVFIDEIEKEVGGVQSSNKTDGGVLNSMFSIILQRMQDIYNKRLKVFFCASSNGIEEIPTPLLRRFQNIFFVDLPNNEEKIKIFEIHLRKNGLNPKEFELKNIAMACNNFTPNDIARSINEAIAVFSYEKENKILRKNAKFNSNFLYNFVNNRFYSVTASRVTEVNDMRKMALERGYRLANKSFFLDIKTNDNNSNSQSIGFKKSAKLNNLDNKKKVNKILL